jgi:hypothetical protein
MNNEILAPLAKELATRVNKMVDIPFVKEADEQAFFEMMIMLVLDVLLSQLGKELKQ